jgi:hydroxymethylbilane synthase
MGTRQEFAQVCPDFADIRDAIDVTGRRAAVSNSTGIRIGTRGSALAIAQAQLVADRLSVEGTESTLEIIASDGDRDKCTPLTTLGGKGIFASSLQQALHESRIDIAVHSAKDLPTVRPRGLSIAAILSRDDVRDVLISRHGLSLAELPSNPRIGTSSRRRMAQVLHVRPDTQTVDLRGNIDTRIRRALETDLDGIVIAAAGLHRLGWQDRITEYLDPSVFVPAPGQAALAIEVRTADRDVFDLITRLDEAEVHLAVDVERAFLAELGAGCAVPVGATARVLPDGAVDLAAMMADEAGLRPRWRRERLPRASAVDEARTIAREMRAIGSGRADVSGPGTLAAQPLLGRTVLITRDCQENDPLAVEIRLRGGVPVISPALRIERRELDSQERALIERFGDGEFNWIVFTSQNAIRSFRDLLDAMAISPPQHVRVAVVGPTTAAAARDAGFRIDLTPPVANGRGLAESLLKEIGGAARILHVCGSLARPEFGDVIRGKRSVVLTDLITYDTLPATGSDPTVAARFLRNDIDAMVFMSPSAIAGLRAQTGEAWARIRDIPATCLGNSTAAAARDMGLRCVLTSPVQTASAVVAALEGHFRGGERQGTAAAAKEIAG